MLYKAVNIGEISSRLICFGLSSFKNVTSFGYSMCAVRVILVFEDRLILIRFMNILVLVGSGCNDLGKNLVELKLWWNWKYRIYKQCTYDGREKEIVLRVHLKIENLSWIKE